MARRCSALATVALLLIVLTACGSPLPPAQVQPVAELSIICEPADAMLLVDDRYVGAVAALKSQPLRLAVGLHRIELRRDGYFAHYAEVHLGRGTVQKLAVKLRKEPF